MSCWFVNGSCVVVIAVGYGDEVDGNWNGF